MQQGSTVCAARGNYSSWEHRRHYVEFSHLLQSNEAFLVAWISVSPDLPQCLKCLMTAAGIFQLNSFFTSIMLMPYVMVMVDQPVSDCFCILQTCLLPQQLRHLCRGLITLGTTPSPDRTQLEGKVKVKGFWEKLESFQFKMATLKNGKSISGQRLDHQRWRQICEPVTSDDTLLHQAKNLYISSTWNTLELHQAKNPYITSAWNTWNSFELHQAENL